MVCALAPPQFSAGGGGEFESSSAYSYPLILPFTEFDVSAGETVIVDLSYRMCEGLGSLHYALAKHSF